MASILGVRGLDKRAGALGRAIVDYLVHLGISDAPAVAEALRVDRHNDHLVELGRKSRGERGAREVSR